MTTSAALLSVDARKSRVSPPLLGLVAVQVIVALTAAGLDLAKACGACVKTTELHGIIAIVGAAAYAILFLAGCLGRVRPFAIGVSAAAGVHAALMIWMVEKRTFCALCLVSAAVALVLIAVSLRMRVGTVMLLERVTLPALLLAGGATFALDAIEESRRDMRNRAIQEFQTADARDETPAAGRPLQITVFEMDHCPYCRDFRDLYWPRLKQEFGSKIAVRFLPAESADWVKRSPTIAIEAGGVFEGLPFRYEDLRQAVTESLAARG